MCQVQVGPLFDSTLSQQIVLAQDQPEVGLSQLQLGVVDPRIVTGPFSPANRPSTTCEGTPATAVTRMMGLAVQESGVSGAGRVS